MTQGKTLKTIVNFAVPVLLGNILQNIYNMADTAIVGRTISTDALAAVGATGAIFSLFVGIIGGMMSGFAAVAGRKFGALDFSGLKKVYINGLVITLVISLIATMFGTLLVNELLALINTPADIIESSADYLRIIFAGISTTMLYNFSGEMLRALGNSRKPFFYLIIACVVNIILDFVFILGFGWGVKGAAAATVAAQALSAVLCMTYTFRSVEYFRFRLAELRPEIKVIGECLHIGIPNSLLNGVILVGIIIMQTVTNSFGTDYVASYSGSNTVTNLLIAPVYAFAATLAVFSAQNYGAGNLTRVKKGVNETMRLLFAVYVALSVLSIFVSKPLLTALYGYGEATAKNAALLMNIKLCTIFFLIPLVFYKAVLQALGKPLFPTLSGFLEITVRYVVATQITKAFGFLGVALTDPITWIITCVFFIITYRYEFKKLEERLSEI